MIIYNPQSLLFFFHFFAVHPFDLLSALQGHRLADYGCEWEHFKVPKEPGVMQDGRGTLKGATLRQDGQSVDQWVIGRKVGGVHQGTQDLLIPLVHGEIFLVKSVEVDRAKSEGTRDLLLEDLDKICRLK